MFAFYFLVFAITSALAGCDHPQAASSRPPVTPGTAILRGTVRFIGTAPTPQPIGGNCCPGSPPVLDESLRVNPNGTLKNVVIFIKDGPNLDLGPVPERVLAQKDCQYVPHVIALRTGQTLVVTSHDPTIHNVHIEADANPSQNFSEGEGASHAVTFDKPEVVRFKCDVHPWMTGYAYVLDHPCFAVTGDDGSFEIAHLPPGTYTLVAWHEKLGTQQMQVTVGADKLVDVKVEYRGE